MTTKNMKHIKTIAGFLAVTAIMILLAVQFTGGYSSRSNYIVDDRSLATGDTFRSGWYDIGGSPDVAATLEVSDSVNARVDFFYRFGNGGATVACIPISDSLGITNLTVATGSAKQKELRGYGLTYARVRSAGDTVRSAIPGAGQIQAKITVHGVSTSSASGGSNRVKVGIITSD